MLAESVYKGVLFNGNFLEFLHGAGGGIFNFQNGNSRWPWFIISDFNGRSCFLRILVTMTVNYFLQHVHLVQECNHHIKWNKKWYWMWIVEKC